MNKKTLVGLGFWILLVLNFWLIFCYAPEEATQGVVQKIFYYHVSSAFCMYFGFLIAGLGALLYLLKKEDRYEALSEAGAEVGLLFCTMVLVSGPLWARPIWGTWWTWDPRLTTTLLVWLLFLAITFLRRFVGDQPRGKVATAVLTLFALLDLPLIFLAVKLWRGVHPSVLGKSESMPPSMRLTLIVSNITVMILFFALVRISYLVALRQQRLAKEIL